MDGNQQTQMSPEERAVMGAYFLFNQQNERFLSEAERWAPALGQVVVHMLQGSAYSPSMRGALLPHLVPIFIAGFLLGREAKDASQSDHS